MAQPTYEEVWLAASPRTREILKYRSDGFTLEDIALELNVTRERVRQIEARGKKDLLRRTVEAFPSLVSDVAQLRTNESIIAIRSIEGLLGAGPYPAVDGLIGSLGLVKCRAWGRIIPGWYESTSGALQACVNSALEFAPFYDKDLEEVCEAIGLSKDLPVRQILGSQSSPLVTDKTGAWVRRKSKNRDSIYLLLREQSAPCDAELIAEAIGAVSGRAVAELLRRNDDTFVQLRPEGTWALADWNRITVNVDYSYRDATEAVLDVIRERGPITQSQLIAETLRRYPVTASRIVQIFANSLIGVDSMGSIDLVERGAKLLEPAEPRQPATVARSGDILAFRMPVSSELLRGSGLGVNPWIGWQLGLHYYPSKVEFSGVFPVVIRRQSSGVSISSLRRSVLALGMTQSCVLLVLLNLKDLRVDLRHVCGDACQVRDSSTP